MNIMSGKIKPQDCRDFALERFTPDVVAPKYDDYFERILDLYKISEDSSHLQPMGWYTNHKSRWEKQASNMCINPNPRNEVILEDF